MDAISSIAELLSLCGIVSVRMFAPTFLFGAICRFMPGCSWCPDGVIELAKSCPSFLTSNFGLFVFGVLGTLEVIANWDDSIKELISESNIETYVKPVFATLMTYSILTPEQVQVVATAFGDITNTVQSAASVVMDVTNSVPADAAAAATAVANAVPPAAETATSGSWFSVLVASLFSCGGTFGLCKVRSGIVAMVREVDPDNTFKLNSLLTMIEEGSWLAVLPILLIFPLLALLLMALFAFFGWLLFKPLGQIAKKRRAYWDSVGKEGMLKKVRMRAIVIFAVGVIASGIPIIGYLGTVVALYLFVFGVLAQYEKRSSRIIAKLVMRFIKLTILLVAIVFSSIPFLGIILLLPYLISYLIRAHKVSQQVFEHVA